MRIAPGRLVGALLQREGRILLGQRSRAKRSWPGAWDFPGGHVEAYETFVQALLRETGEEVGVVPQRFRVLADCRTEEGEPYRIFLVDAWRGGEPRLTNREHSRLRWFTAEEASLLHPLADRRYVQLFQLVARTVRQS